MFSSNWSSHNRFLLFGNFFDTVNKDTLWMIIGKKMLTDICEYARAVAQRYMKPRIFMNNSLSIPVDKEFKQGDVLA